ncbi:hypothetical protein SCYAM73S_03953 [Streptomyces cyaneofuscatus]
MGPPGRYARGYGHGATSVDTVSLTGWGRTAPTTAVRFRPRTYEEAAAVVRDRGPRGALRPGARAGAR